MLMKIIPFCHRTGSVYFAIATNPCKILAATAIAAESKLKCCKCYMVHPSLLSMLLHDVMTGASSQKRPPKKNIAIPFFGPTKPSKLSPSLSLLSPFLCQLLQSALDGNNGHPRRGAACHAREWWWSPFFSGRGRRFGAGFWSGFLICGDRSWVRCI